MVERAHDCTFDRLCRNLGRKSNQHEPLLSASGKLQLVSEPQITRDEYQAIADDVLPDFTIRGSPQTDVTNVFGGKPYVPQVARQRAREILVDEKLGHSRHRADFFFGDGVRCVGERGENILLADSVLGGDTGNIHAGRELADDDIDGNPRAGDDWPAKPDALIDGDSWGDLNHERLLRAYCNSLRALFGHSVRAGPPFSSAARIAIASHRAPSPSRP
jgi:hypothetical protein